MASQQQSDLCGRYHSINFASYFQPPAPGEIGIKNGVGEMLYERTELGVSSDIRKKGETCAFCHLIAKATGLISPEAGISIGSVFCGRKRASSSADPPELYCIRVSSEYSGNRNTCNLQLLAEEADSLGLSRDFLTRLPRADGFDIQQACDRLDICFMAHSSLCESLEGEIHTGISLSLPSDLLAIDLMAMCICRLPEGAEYMALSYCWPVTEYLTREKKNKEAISSPGALDNNFDNLHGTV